MGNEQAMMNRRELLALSAAAVATAAVPLVGAESVVATASQPLPVWLVGEPGEFNWQAIRAKTAEEARKWWACEHVGFDDCEQGGEIKANCDCELCIAFNSADADRKPQLDSLNEITPGDWLRVGSGHVCSRCSYETFPDEGGKAVGNEAVCADCMTLADWDIVDPDRAAEIRAEAADDA
jgi:hypothetical protein